MQSDKQDQAIRLFEALEGVDPMLLERSEKQKKVIPIWRYGSAVAACLALVFVGMMSWNGLRGAQKAMNTDAGGAAEPAQYIFTGPKSEGLESNGAADALAEAEGGYPECVMMDAEDGAVAIGDEVESIAHNTESQKPDPVLVAYLPDVLFEEYPEIYEKSLESSASKGEILPAVSRIWENGEDKIEYRVQYRTVEDLHPVENLSESAISVDKFLQSEYLFTGEETIRVYFAENNMVMATIYGVRNMEQLMAILENLGEGYIVIE